MPTTPKEVIQGELVIIPDPQVPIRQIHFRTDPQAGRFGIYFTEDGGSTFRALLLVPTAEAKDLPGSFLTLDDNRDAQWVHNPVPVSYTHLTLPTTLHECRSRWSPYH